MKILSITAQKPNSTGSGVYLTELVKEYAKAGHTQSVVAGIYTDDHVELPEGVTFYPVYFESEKLPFPITGMSDEMPYKSTRYCDLTEEMIGQFEAAFFEVIDRAVEELDPDVILCHHLYLLTAMVREHYPDRKVYGFCHNTDLRQMVKNELRRDYIRERIRKLDRIFAPQAAQEQGVLRLYEVDPKIITRVGIGYNSEVFYRREDLRSGSVKKIVFVGKITQKKGVASLLRAMAKLPQSEIPTDSVKLYLVGGTGNEEEYREILGLAEDCPYEVVFTGRLDQRKLAEVYNSCDIFTLPSFFDAIPLTIIEALACGDRVVISELAGVREWLKEMVPHADAEFVALPAIRNADEPVEEELPAYEDRLAKALTRSILKDTTDEADTTGIAWSKISQKVLDV